VLLWKEIKGKKLGVQFLRQRPIGNYIVDFYCSKLNLAIEIDGVSHDAKTESDETRDKILEKSGIKIIRFRDIDIKTNLESVVRKIEECIKNPSAFGHSL
jgi:very-short-patch-repair endonuclease